MGELMRLRPELENLMHFKGKTVAVVNSSTEGNSSAAIPCMRIAGKLETDPRVPDGTGRWAVILGNGTYASFTAQCVSLILAQPPGSTFGHGVEACIFVAWQNERMGFAGKYGEF